MKKITSLLLTVALLAAVLTAFAVTAFAEEQKIGSSNVTWELTGNGTLIIGGTGEMPDFYFNGTEDRPWADAVENIFTVIINPGVTSIGKSAFLNCLNLTSAAVPYGVTSIGDYAFNGCVSLKSVTVPSSVKSIGMAAFQACSSLPDITIPSGVTSIGVMAFSSCTSLTSVTVPSSVKSIGMMALCTTGLLSFTFKAVTPPTLGINAIPNNSDLAVYVPFGADGAYKTVTGLINEAYIVDDLPAENGTITVDKDCFPKSTYTEPNETVTITVTPAEGYQLKAGSLSVSDDNGAAIALTQDKTDPAKYTFTMPKANVTVKAEFEKIPNADNTGSTISGGNVWIIVAIAFTVILLEVLVYLSKRNKKKNA